MSLGAAPGIESKASEFPFFPPQEQKPFLILGLNLLQYFISCNYPLYMWFGWFLSLCFFGGGGMCFMPLLGKKYILA